MLVKSIWYDREMIAERGKHIIAIHGIGNSLNYEEFKQYEGTEFLMNSQNGITPISWWKITTRGLSLLRDKGLTIYEYQRKNTKRGIEGMNLAKWMTTTTC